MDERALRTALLARAIEETDRDGTLLPPADRAQATRDTLRADPDVRDALARPDPAPAFERFLASRSARLVERLSSRHPALATLVARGDRLVGAGRWLLVAAFACGLVLSTLDRSRLVNVLAFPLAGLVLWNVAVYVAIGIAALRRHDRSPAAASLYRRVAERRLAAWLQRSEEFDASLARALRAFAAEWQSLARPWLAAHAARLFHAGAACVAVGLVAGLYWRGLTLEYRAGWESTFLDAASVRAVLAIVYGPASALTGIPLPTTAAEIAALHWRSGAGGVVAAPWIHLIAATAILWIVVPRVLLALVATWNARRFARRTGVPPALLGYARDLLAGEGVAIGGHPVEVFPYALDVPGTADAALARVLGVALRSSVRPERRPTVAYGAEDAFLAVLERAPPPAGMHAVVLCNLASTPEAENHGAVIAGVRDAVKRRGREARTLVVVDASAYARRMGEGALAARVQERADAWRAFVRGYGLDAVIVDLERVGAAPRPEADALVRAALAR
jgi:hypothetical protein